jgi:dolichol-phosphate mannosyltransferase
LEPDEGRYAEVVREMLASGDWGIPRLNGVPFYDKPLLFYWLVGGSFRLFGVGEAAARLVPALAAFLTVLACFVLGRRVAGARPAFLGALVLALTVGFVQCGRVVILDSLLALFVTLALLAGYEAVRGERLRRAWWAASAVFCSLGVMTKGPVALVLLAPPLAAHAWLLRTRARPRFRDWAAYGGLVLALAAPLYALQIARDRHFASHFFVDQHLVRFFLHEYHVEPAWYYLPVLAVGFLPWSFLALPLGRLLLDRSPGARASRPPALGFFLLWAGWCVLFFSRSSSKLPPYILPAMPAIALLFGWCLDRVLFGTSPAVLLRGARTAVPRCAGAVVAAVLLVGSIGAWKMRLIGPGPALAQGCLFAVCLALLVVWGGRLSARAGWLLCGALGAFLVVTVAHEFVPAWAGRRSPLTRFAEIARAERQARTPVACYDGEWGSVPFYLGRTAGIINRPGLTPAELVPSLIVQPRCLLVVRHKADLEVFRWATTPFLALTGVRYADEIGVGVLEAAPWWKKMLDAAAPFTGGP